MKVKSESEVAQSYPTPSDPMDCSPPGSSIQQLSVYSVWLGLEEPHKLADILLNSESLLIIMVEFGDELMQIAPLHMQKLFYCTDLNCTFD